MVIFVIDVTAVKDNRISPVNLASGYPRLCRPMYRGRRKLRSATENSTDGKVFYRTKMSFLRHSLPPFAVHQLNKVLAYAFLDPPMYLLVSLRAMLTCRLGQSDDTITFGNFAQAQGPSLTGIQ
jgi:hypothetical protein